MKILWNGKNSPEHLVTFVRIPNKSLRWTTDATYKSNGLFSFHTAIIESLEQAVPNIHITYTKKGYVRLRFDNQADEVHFLMVIDGLEINMDANTI